MASLELILIVVLVLLNGLLAMSELAVVSARPIRLKALADRGINGARRAIKLASDPGRFLSTVQIGITLVGVIAGAISGATLGGRLSDWLMGFGLSESIAEPIGFGLIIAGVTSLSLILGEIVPKQIALRNPERIACLVAPGMMLLSKAASPFAWLLKVSSQIVLRIFGHHRMSDQKVTDEEIHTLVAEAESTGVLEPEERSMISGIMRLGDRQVRAVMTQRREVDMIDLSDDEAEMRRKILSSPHSRIVVTDGSPNTIVGVIQAKDLLNGYLKRRWVSPRKLVVKAPIIPEIMSALDVVSVLKSSSVHVGLVHDEYGHFQGLVTSADILESIVGEFRTEEGPPEPSIVKRDDGSYLVSGTALIDELSAALGRSFPEKRDYHTAAGFLLERFGRLPSVGEHFIDYGWRFEVVDLDGRRIDKILISRMPVAKRVAR
jgi:putative hemolysin